MRTATIQLSILLLVTTLCTFGCRRQYSNYCPGALNDNCLNVDAPIDSPKVCTTDQECAPLVCDVAASRVCVQCTSTKTAACTGMAPVCGSNDKCRACTKHAECTSNACLPDGSCGTDTTVAYVDPMGTGVSCTQLAPCKKIADAIQTARPFVKLHGTTNEQVTLNNVNVTFLADPGAMLTDAANGILLKVDGTSRVTIYDLTITGASGMNNPGVSLQPGNASTVALIRTTVSSNAGGGIVASGGTLTVSQSSFLNNSGGGISITNGVFAIVGNVFFNNGGNTSLIGGVSIGTVMNAANRLEFNSVVLNTAQDGTASGIHCLAGTFTAKNNIVSNNRNPTMTMQLDGGCAHGYSIVRPGTVPIGAMNAGDDPMFVNEATGDLHLQSASPARGKADPATDLTGFAARDIDGIARVSPADIGAYQFHPSGTSLSPETNVEGEPQ